MSASAGDNLLARVFDWIKARAVLSSELAAMSRADLQLLATDIGVSEADLRAIAPQLSDHSDLLDKMITARGLEPELVRRIFVGAVRDMETTCARCRDAGFCERELKAGTAAARSHEFCGNATMIDELLGLDT